MSNNERIMRAEVYRGHSIVVNRTGAPEGRLRDTFSIHKHADDGSDLRTSLYERTISQATEHTTEEEARESALRHAKAWIDALYS